MPLYRRLGMQLEPMVYQSLQSQYKRGVLLPVHIMSSGGPQDVWGAGVEQRAPQGHRTSRCVYEVCCSWWRFAGGMQVKLEPVKAAQRVCVCVCVCVTPVWAD